jgi:transcription elongation factor GreA
MKKIFHLTLHGKRELEEELQELVSSRVAISERIAEARSFGDLSENAEYSTAREAQERTESRIVEIENILANAGIIKGDGAKNGVGLGDSVKLKSGRQTMEYKLVGKVEADPLNGKISDESPLGRQLLGKNVGDSVTVDSPRGDKKYEILEIA